MNTILIIKLYLAAAVRCMIGMIGAINWTNRYALITDLLDGGMEPFRQMQYKYYREGLDVMSENVERGRAAITQALELLNKAHDNKSMSALPQIFTEFKRDELLNIYKGHASSQEKDKVVNILTRINASQSSYWRDI